MINNEHEEEDNFRTPTKTYSRGKSTNKVSQQCRLCGEDKTQLQKIYSSVGRAKNLEEKIQQCCGGVVISVDDKYEKSICTKCEKFINKIYFFHKRCKEVAAKSEVLVNKRCSKSSPSKKSHKRLKFSPIDPGISDLTAQVDVENSPYLQILMNAEEKSPSSCATFLMSSCPNIIQNVKSHILSGIESKAAHLCCRKEGRSLLYEKDYNDLTSLDFELIFNEFSQNFPFVCQMLQVMSSKKKDLSEDGIPKMCMIYSMLLNSRWHELSRLKRVITILLIEGGCSKKVSFYFYLIDIRSDFINNSL